MASSYTAPLYSVLLRCSITSSYVSAVTAVRAVCAMIHMIDDRAGLPHSPLLTLRTQYSAVRVLIMDTERMKLRGKRDLTPFCLISVTEIFISRLVAVAVCG